MTLRQRAGQQVLEAERTIMRELNASDADGLQEVIGDPHVMGNQARTIEQTRGWIRYHMPGYTEHGFALWAVIAKDRGELIGDCGILYRTIAGGGEFGLGYHLRRDCWGCGIATEAAQAVCDTVGTATRVTSGRCHAAHQHSIT
ncbi:MAG: GNAT family N-acetyltransferase [Candidatus Dormibacteraeota bacterium]|uniref:GNAT family N-acetyltransferase n=1 Tax=Candidatus Aeolococcus gillhamiae TaxID=3127015 RepID=A0A934JUC6_9BACT|nr:GNAT family N-acetyltransferase [Candidatus Dormibacteraeota bacterium]